MSRIDPDVFTYQEDLLLSLETFVVMGTDDTQAVIEALQRAGERFMRVDESGAEHADDDSAEAALDSGLYTPNYVSRPRVTELGVQMYLDCKGSIEDPMSGKLRAVLEEELDAAHIDPAPVKAVPREP